MPGTLKTVVLLWQHQKDLTEELKKILETSFGWDISYVPTNPRDGREHLSNCELLMPVAVISFKKDDWAILAPAVDAKFQHFKFVPGRGNGLPADIVPLEICPASKGNQ